MSIQSTKNYELFKFLPENRDIKSSILEKLTKSIKRNNFLCDFPLIVDSNYNVLDGQHRLAVAKALKLPIYYIISNTIKSDDMAFVNDAGGKWIREDYIKHFAEKGNVNYVKLRDLLKKLNIPIHEAIIYIGGEKRVSKSLRDGTYIYDIVEDNFIEYFNKFKTVTEVLKGYLPNAAFHYSRCWRRALYLFVQAPTTDYDHFMRKLPYCLNRLRPTLRIADALTILNSIQEFQKHGKNKEQGE